MIPCTSPILLLSMASSCTVEDSSVSLSRTVSEGEQLNSSDYPPLTNPSLASNPPGPCNMEKAGFMTYTAASHQGAIKMIPLRPMLPAAKWQQVALITTTTSLHKLMK
ncbi:unnamed protein product [Pleuronectes platessa]|uniref:Uncharacterized protein n=1 Tax=Pleuronectes platessa TaxID=8262 RepID=A0A9N7UU90_PLEPL|nr:unnamed protein product [Pleuronectes platessa]